MNKGLTNMNVGMLMAVLLFGFYGQFIIINSQAMVKHTLNVSLSSNNNADSSLGGNNSNITQPFQISYEMLINDSHLLTQTYQKEIGKWQSKQYDNKTMISITDNYLPRFQKLVNRAGSLQPTTAKYLQAKDLYVKSLQSEIRSYIHFRNFLVTGNRTEDDTSTQLLSSALNYEIKSFAAFNNRTVTDTDNNYGNRSFVAV
ncbi:MAG TPA: hypothetical protein VI278_08945 [Nitrososphaeraceae archaeon]